VELCCVCVLLCREKDLVASTRLLAYFFVLTAVAFAPRR